MKPVGETPLKEQVTCVPCFSQICDKTCGFTFLHGSEGSTQLPAFEG